MTAFLAKYAKSIYFGCYAEQEI